MQLTNCIIKVYSIMAPIITYIYIVGLTGVVVQKGTWKCRAIYTSNLDWCSTLPTRQELWYVTWRNTIVSIHIVSV